MYVHANPREKPWREDEPSSFYMIKCVHVHANLVFQRVLLEARHE